MAGPSNIAGPSHMSSASQSSTQPSASALKAALKEKEQHMYTLEKWASERGVECKEKDRQIRELQQRLKRREEESDVEEGREEEQVRQGSDIEKEKEEEQEPERPPTALSPFNINIHNYNRTASSRLENRPISESSDQEHWQQRTVTSPVTKSPKASPTRRKISLIIAGIAAVGLVSRISLSTRSTDTPATTASPSNIKTYHNNDNPKEDASEMYNFHCLNCLPNTDTNDERGDLITVDMNSNGLHIFTQEESTESEGMVPTRKVTEGKWEVTDNVYFNFDGLD